MWQILFWFHSKLLLIAERGEIHKHQGQTIASLNVDDLNIEDPDHEPLEVHEAGEMDEVCPIN